MSGPEPVPKGNGTPLRAPSTETPTTHNYSTGDGCQYQKLPLELTQNGGHRYVQVWRDDYAAVYEQHNQIRLIGYEAITIKHQEAKSMFGRSYPAKELYPCSEDWGSLAFTTNSLEKAMAYAKSMSKRVEKTRRKAISSPRIAQRRTGRGVSATPTNPLQQLSPAGPAQQPILDRTERHNRTGTKLELKQELELEH